MAITPSCGMIGASNVVAKFNTGGVLFEPQVIPSVRRAGGLVASQQDTLDEQVGVRDGFFFRKLRLTGWATAHLS